MILSGFTCPPGVTVAYTMKIVVTIVVNMIVAYEWINTPESRIGTRIYIVDLPFMTCSGVSEKSAKNVSTNRKTADESQYGTTLDRFTPSMRVNSPRPAIVTESSNLA